MNLLESLHFIIQSGVAAGYLPSMLQYGFVINALLAGCLLGPLLGGLGMLVVVKRFAFFSEAVGHAALTGIAIGVLLGEPHASPYGSLSVTASSSPCCSTTCVTVPASPRIP